MVDCAEHLRVAVSLVAVLRTPYSLPPSCFAATVAVLNLLQEDSIMYNHAKNPSIDILGIQNDFDHYMAQTRAVLASLISDNNFENLNPEHTSSALWLVLDRLEDLNTANQAIVAAKVGGV
jgi:hypothetical protein